MTAIRFANVRKNFGETVAIDIGKLAIADGQIVCFVGPSRLRQDDGASGPSRA